MKGRSVGSPVMPPSLQLPFPAAGAENAAVALEREPVEEEGRTDWEAERGEPPPVVVVVVVAAAFPAGVVYSVGQLRTGSCLCGEGFAVAGEADWHGDWPVAEGSETSAEASSVAESPTGAAPVESADSAFVSCRRDESAFEQHC